jgi:DNA (cytosine-5)-methyltransferase 1
MPQFYEFFAGGGMARAGLGDGWNCLLANDFCEMKAAAYRANWGSSDLLVQDINKLKVAKLPGLADLAWASFPCQDLSLAGNYIGIGTDSDTNQTRSGTFWAFWKLMISLGREGRLPRVIVLENVYGVLTSRGGKDFAAIGLCFAQAGYKFGALLIDAARFVPQSRPRVFIVGVRADVSLPSMIYDSAPSSAWHPKALIHAYEGMSERAKAAWLWWQMPIPDDMPAKLENLIDDEPVGINWHTPAETRQLIAMMSDRNLEKLERMQSLGRRTVGTIYKRTRQGIQRAELRCDGVAGCLRTPAGGSSRQFVIVVEGKHIRSRLLSTREAARLMGLSEKYQLPSRYNDAYHLAGDGVAVPVVRHLAACILEPVLSATSASLTPVMAAA